MANQGKRMVSEDLIKKLESLEPVDLNDYQKKLTAGENITITEDNVISATSSGANIYNHSIVFKSYISEDSVNVSIRTILATTNNTPFTVKTFLDMIYNNAVQKPINVAGAFTLSSKMCIIYELKLVLPGGNLEKFQLSYAKEGEQYTFGKYLDITRNEQGEYSGTNLSLTDEIF